MEYSKLSIYENVDVEKPSILTRSVLYPLEPIGIGTEHVESFTSYINRLAFKHNVSVKDLFLNIVLVNYGREYLLNSSKISGVWRESSLFNSLTNWSYEFVNIFSNLTTRKDLKYLTILTLNNVFSNEIISKTKAYCPKCYENDKLNNGEIYDRLIWNFKVIDICPIHKIHLQNKCPYEDCRKNLIYLKSFSIPGYCPHCNRWLGTITCNEADNEMIQSQRWIIEQIQKILVELSEFEKSHCKENVNRALDTILEEYGDGIVYRLSKYLGINDRTVAHWYARETAPNFNSLLRICFKLNVSLAHLLKFGTLKDFSIENKYLRVDFISRDGMKRTNVNKDELKNILEKFLDSGPPLSVRAISRALNVSADRLWFNFPEICKKIASKRQKYISDVRKEKTKKLCKEVREKTILIYESGRHPSLLEVGKYFSSSAIFKRKEVYNTWKSTLKDISKRVSD